MSREDYEAETRQRMLDLDPVTRAATLAMTIVEMHPRDTAAAINGMMKLCTMMAKMHSLQKRIELANLLRDEADQIERSLHLVK
jgi:hypothetical protein